MNRPTADNPHMRPDYTIEECDVTQVAPLRAAIHFDDLVSPEWTIDNLDAHETSRHWIVTHKRQPVACATLARDPKHVLGQHATHRLRWLGVHDHHRGKGIAIHLIHHRLTLAHEDGAEWVWSDAVTTAVPLYTRLGATPDVTHWDPIEANFHTNVLYGPLPDNLHLVTR